jgi:hypothetical protein
MQLGPELKHVNRTGISITLGSKSQEQWSVAVILYLHTIGPDDMFSQTVSALMLLQKRH